MESYTNSQIAKYIRQQDWSGIHPSPTECSRHWSGKTLEEGYDLFKASRDSMFRAEKAAIQSRTCAMSDRGAAAYANNWN